MWLLGVSLGILGLWWLATRAGELFVISVRRGQPLLVRGRIPPSTYDALVDVLRRSGVTEATLRVTEANGAPAVDTRGMNEFTQQRLRNTLALTPIARLRQAPRRTDGNLGTLLGITWLAWLLNR